MGGDRLADKIARALLIAFAVGVLGYALVDAATADEPVEREVFCVTAEGCLQDDPGFFEGG